MNPTAELGYIFFHPAVAVASSGKRLSQGRGPFWRQLPRPSRMLPPEALPFYRSDMPSKLIRGSEEFHIIIIGAGCRDIGDRPG